MGTLEFENDLIIIHSHLVIYGNAADPAITDCIRVEIERMWNEPEGTVYINKKTVKVCFKITAELQKGVTDLDIYRNTDPRNNYFRIEEFAHGNISFVDGLGCNSGYFKLENLYPGSTTAAHEYGHTLGLKHPEDLDIRGKGQPGIMYPRGTLVDPQFQYDPAKAAGTKGGTLHPMFRKVLQHDIDKLQIHRLRFKNNKAIIGDFTNVFHPDHSQISHSDFFGLPGA